jgi:hypothetical protein
MGQARGQVASKNAVNVSYETTACFQECTERKFTKLLRTLKPHWLQHQHGECEG